MVAQSALGHLFQAISTEISRFEDDATAFIQNEDLSLTPWRLAEYLCLPLIPAFVLFIAYALIRNLSSSAENHSVRISSLLFVVFIRFPSYKYSMTEIHKCFN